MIKNVSLMSDAVDRSYNESQCNITTMKFTFSVKILHKTPSNDNMKRV